MLLHCEARGTLPKGDGFCDCATLSPSTEKKRWYKGSIVQSLVCCREVDLRKLLAWFTVSNVTRIDALLQMTGTFSWLHYMHYEMCNVFYSEIISFFQTSMMESARLWRLWSVANKAFCSFSLQIQFWSILYPHYIPTISPLYPHYIPIISSVYPHCIPIVFPTCRFHRLVRYTLKIKKARMERGSRPYVNCS